MNTPSFQEGTASWQSDQQTARCLSVVNETWDVKTFWFALQGNEPLRFKPGQFLTFTFTIQDQEVVRCYTIASAPTQPYQFAITVKRVPDGLVSNWLHEYLKAGDEVIVSAPAGHFNCIEIAADKYLFLSGGSGITPSMSMVRWLKDTGQHKDVNFIHSSRTPGDIIFHDELLRIDTRWFQFQLSLLCESKGEEHAWAGYKGRLSSSLLELICPDYQQRMVFCCGPSPYMQAVREILESLSFPMERYVEESFGAPTAISSVISSDQEAASLSANYAQISFTKSGKQGNGNSSETLLDIAMASGVWIQSACRAGICGSCKVRKISGIVNMEGAMALSDTECSEGYILACCAYPQGDITLEA